MTLKLTMLTSVSGEILAFTVIGVVETAPNDVASEMESFGSETAAAAVCKINW